ncbi:MAG: toxin [Nitrospirae bacterium CG_4_10_14_3_um_filter_44_29]|nr:toxin [Nitrospirota bacterium]PIP69933.1 MAG: toxin [Nitrospirae bacterium CG22_combo_CG10-13_8_21_14_all_44_11]PIV40891.1 MAG: toxin [Nitrospirae bacterium CG02_land_8_20_14_3_00_44_33]PIV66183.1 MAG: toxin [Nitrospirae bacterium CG01_land_8_20_14_3_00_44_22]PIW89296.1 MAG: toxin [Nitrospirae bacterium CG_4_8_14_3_um_filter_44_28]PIX88031.1 MAG: toxin [Nitrospirae bacterium CG_4_10_14_3_um_filter_44_29]PJA82600.1 MAG: toxin [Nitrospirae bacterium CG_4_9_14_3_um_filter_44_28]
MADKAKPSPEEIEQFLENFKSCWDGNVVPRLDEKNDETLSSLGITPRHRAEEVKRLHYTDYFRGPSPDYDGIAGKEWWEFGLRVKGHEIYIKIRIYKRERGSYGGKCMSFHIAEEKITYPFKEKRDENHD